MGKKKEELDKIFEEGTQLYKEKKYEEAIKKWSEIKEDDHPYYFMSMGVIGNTYLVLKDYDKAIEYLKIVLEKEDDTFALGIFSLDLGIVYYRKNNIKDALKYIEKSIKYDGTTPNPYFEKGRILYFQKKYTEALDSLVLAEERIEHDTSIGISPSLFYIMGHIHTILENLEKATVYFSKVTDIDEYGIVETIRSTKENIDKNKAIQTILPAFLDAKQDNFFNHIVKDTDPETRKIYKEIYIQALQIIALLQVNSEEEEFVAHYTTKGTAEMLLFAESPFRLNTTTTGNDPKEGLSLMDCLKQRGIDTKSLKRDAVNKAFIACFTFNHESLNQFRLYGKDHDVEATGVSIVVDSSFFNASLASSVDIKRGIIETAKLDNTPSTTDTDADDKKKEEEDTKVSKLPLYRCIYIDPDTGKVASVGHRESYTYYRENNNKIGDKKAEEKIEKYEGLISQTLSQVKEQIEGNRRRGDNKVQGLIPMIEDALKKKDVHLSVINELLIALRYLVKHVAFKEEQECRIFSIQNVRDNKNIKPEMKEDKVSTNFNQMFIEYGADMQSSVCKVYFAPQAEGYDLFCDNIQRYIKREESKEQVKCVRCNFPFFKR